VVVLAALAGAASAKPGACPESNRVVVDGRKAELRGDFEASAKLFDAACAKDDGIGCYDLGTAANLGKGIARAKDLAKTLYAKAAPLLEKSCDAGCADACAALGWTFHTGQGRTADDKRAVALMDKSCTLKSAEGCFLLAQVYGFGYGVAVDHDRGHALAVIACDLGDALGCNSVAYDFKEGQGVAKDPRSEKQFHERACRLGLLESCTELKLPLPAKTP